MYNDLSNIKVPDTCSKCGGGFWYEDNINGRLVCLYCGKSLYLDNIFSQYRYEKKRNKK